VNAIFDGRDPIYLQIADQIRDDILDGALKEEDQVMSTTQYATTYRINPATAAKAFSELVDEGVLYKRRGVGMFVATGAREALAAHGRERFFADVLDPAVSEARRLGIDLEDVIARIRLDAAAQPPAAAPDSAPHHSTHDSTGGQP
jgi:DNA-binding transcriptional regulator YhcF (GntR family)